MSYIRINSISVSNYRSFGNDLQTFNFPDENYKKPVAIVGYNNAGKTNLMNAILFGIGYNFVSENTFEKGDLYNLDYQNSITIYSELGASDYFVWSDYHNDYKPKSIRGGHRVSCEIVDDELLSKCNPSFYGANKHYNIFYINFHKIKDEISTQKSSWGNLKSFLAKHINKLIYADDVMMGRKDEFNSKVIDATSVVLNGESGEGSKLSRFIKNIKNNYSKNLRNNDCVVEFGLPDYEDIFMQMMFKIGLNGDTTNLVPIDHFGDGYISMFVMAVIQAIAEENTEDKCLFLFEEPESFLHENHQEYFYKNVLCGLSESGHQVIYTTHSDKMVDIFNTQGLIRLEFDKDKGTIKKFNDIEEINLNPVDSDIDPDFNLQNYNSVIKNIEPNLNKILFSQKVILVEGPNDLLVYKYIIERKIREKILEGDDKFKQKYAESWLNFNNISIIPHHGKATAYLLVELCRHIGVDYFLINDWDFEISELSISDISSLNSLEQLQLLPKYIASVKKSMITTNWKLFYISHGKIHFNVPRLESVIGYKSNDKNALNIWKKLEATNNFDESLFPKSLEKFLGIDADLLILKENLAISENEESASNTTEDSELPEIDIESLNVQMPF